MRNYTFTSLAIGFVFQVGCVGLTLSPNATPARLRAYNDNIAQQYVTANEFERQGEFESACQIYQELHEKHPRNPDYLHRLAVVNTRLHRDREAARFYERARLADPQNVRLLADMGYSSYLKDDLSAAEQTLREGLSIQPGNPRCINNLALVLGAQGKMDECQKLLRQLGDESSALANLGYIHAKRGEFALAESKYREALAMNPRLDQAKQALAELALRHPHDDVATLMTPASFETSDLDSDFAEPVNSPAIQQVGAALDGIPSKVITAAFVQPASSKEHGLLDQTQPQWTASKNRDIPASINPAGVVPAVFEPAVFEEDQESNSNNRVNSPTLDWDAEAPVSQSQDDDWANE